MSSTETEPPVQAPTDIAGVGIHLSYIRRDLSIMSTKLDNIANSYVGMAEHIHFKDYVEKNFVLRVEHEENKKKIDELETSAKVLTSFMDTLNGKMLAIGGLSGFLVGLMTLIANHYWR